VKNQTDLIVTIVAVLCMLIGVGVCYGTRKEAVQPPAPEKVVATPLAMPQASVVMADSLPGASGQGAAPQPASGAGRPGGSGGFGPPPGAIPGGGRPGGPGMPQGGLYGPPSGPPPTAATGS
jgi:hypothetical protein